MKHLVIALLALAWSALAQAYGLPYAVDSFKKAQALSQQNASRHVLVFYTSPD
jgi:ribose 1,5-bisphosphokinase PhnN